MDYYTEDDLPDTFEDKLSELSEQLQELRDGQLEVAAAVVSVGRMVMYAVLVFLVLQFWDTEALKSVFMIAVVWFAAWGLFRAVKWLWVTSIGRPSSPANPSRS